MGQRLQQRRLLPLPPPALLGCKLPSWEHWQPQGNSEKSAELKKVPHCSELWHCNGFLVSNGSKYKQCFRLAHPPSSLLPLPSSTSFYFVVREIEPRALCMTGKCSTTELHHQHPPTPSTCFETGSHYVAQAGLKLSL